MSYAIHILNGKYLKRADALNCQFIVTGHYANINEKNGRYYVSKGKDPRKINHMFYGA